MLTARSIPTLLVSLGVLAFVAWALALTFATGSLYANGAGVS